MSEVKLRYNKNGKPTIKGLSFSISHSQNVLVQAFTKNGEIGVDVEYKNSKRKYLAVAKRYFHPYEHQYLQSLDKSAAINCFYHLWTAKEAVCKAKGGRLWYYLADNYLENSCSGKKKNMVKSIKGLNILQFNEIKNFSLTIATQFKPEKVSFIHE
ncbi:MAG: 4'-phosphopantetheinyl transferase superfamily protein [Alcanivoracaceae bacterium]|nr:4'-phosphopantetheinyl transferase superfamily protein [Alcanivoracaceae bacterium]